MMPMELRIAASLANSAESYQRPSEFPALQPFRNRAAKRNDLGCGEGVLLQQPPKARGGVVVMREIEKGAPSLPEHMPQAVRRNQGLADNRIAIRHGDNQQAARAQHAGKFRETSCGVGNVLQNAGAKNSVQRL